MEPTDLKLNSPDDAQIETWLRSHSAAAPLPDDGFSARVLAALPPPATSPKSPLRLWLCVAGALSGCLFAVSSGATGSGGWAQLADLSASLRAAFVPLTDSSFVLALAVTGASLVFVYWRQRLLKLVHK